jgi:hypothetical protein
MAAKTQQFYYDLLSQGYMFRLLRVIIRPSTEPIQNYLITSALWDLCKELYEQGQYVLIYKYLSVVVFYIHDRILPKTIRILSGFLAVYRIHNI